MKILIVAGEASADLHAGLVIAELKKHSSVELIGIGGDQLIAQGLKPLKTAREMAVVGLTEVIRRIPSTLRLMDDLASLAAKEKPDFALLLDLPDFNLRLAPKLKRLGIPVLYYISPQVWAWRSGRVRLMAKCIDRLLTILPFEKPWFTAHAPHTLQVEYVGHPAIEEIPDLPYAPEDSQICVMPGSRESEVRGLLGDLLRSCVALKKRFPNLHFVLPIAEPLRGSALLQEQLSLSGTNAASLQFLGDSLCTVEKPAHEVLRNSKLALVASGTATLEAGIVGVPMLVVYRVAPTTAFIFKYLVNYKGPIALVNLVHLGVGSLDRLVPELIQNNFTPENVVATASMLLEDKAAWTKLRDRLAETRNILSGVARPVENTVRAILDFARKPPRA